MENARKTLDKFFIIWYNILVKRVERTTHAEVIKMYKVFKVSKLAGTKCMIMIAYNKTEDEAKQIIREATDKDFYDYYKMREY